MLRLRILWSFSNRRELLTQTCHSSGVRKNIVRFTKAPILFNSLQLNKPTQLRNHHPLHTFNATGQRWTIARLILALHVIPNLTIGAFTVPTKVSVRDGVY